MRSLLSAVMVFTMSALSHLRADARPNILFIYADDQNYRTVSCYPEAPEWVSTPQIDALAADGLRFERAYYGAWCMPSRASFLTGQLQHAIPTMRMEGQYPASQYDPARCRFWPAELRRAGYHTAQIGKWHTGVDTGNGRDWDHQIVWNRPGHPENAGNYFENQIVTFNGEDREPGGYATDNYTKWAIDYINGENRDREKPWYLWLCYGAVHGPTTPASRHLGSLAGNRVDLPADIFAPWTDKPAYLNEIYSWVPGPNGTAVRRGRNVDTKSNFNTNTAGQSLDSWVQQMNECAMAIDEGVGQLVQALRASGQLENTIIVYTADQGYSLGQHGMNQKVAPYDAAVASPLILWRPGMIPQGKTCRHPVNAPDMVEYFAHLTGVRIPWKTHGRDIRPLIENPETTEWDAPMIMTHTGRCYGEYTTPLPGPQDDAMNVVGGIPWYVLLRDGPYKYIRYMIPGETEELYDLAADPEELQNLAVDPQHQQRLQRLRTLAIAELKKTDAEFADALPPTRQMTAQK